MNFRWILVLVSYLIVVEAAAVAGINRWVDDQGNINFGDIPPTAADTEAVVVETRPVDRTNSRRLKKSSKGWLRSRLSGYKTPVQAKPDKRRDFRQRLRYKNARRKGQLMVGMIPAEVRSMLGKPTTVSVSSGPAGVSELWSYRWPDKKDIHVTLLDGKVNGWR